MGLLINSTKFFILLSTLNEKDKLALVQFSGLESFNPSKKIHILICNTANENPLINKEDLYTILFSNSKYDDRKLRNLLSRSYLFVQKFIAIRYFEQNEDQFYDVSFEAISDKKEAKFIDERLLQWKKNIQENKSLDDSFINQKMKFNDAEFHRTLKNLSNSNRNFKISNYDYNEALDEYFILKKIKLFITSFNYQSFVNTNEEFTLLEELISFVKKKKNRSLVLDVYFNLLMMHYDDTKDIYFFNLKAKFQEIDTGFNEDEKREIYLLIQNFTIKRINRGNSEFLKELFTLFKTMLANETIFEKNKLSQWSYKNIVTVALRLEEYDWCEYFIDNYKSKIDIKYRDEAFSLNKANFYLNIKQFDKALPLLQTINYSDTLSLATAKILQLKIYYELKEFDILVSSIESFDKVLVRNKKLPNQYKVRFKKFNKFLKKILKLKTKKEITSLISQLNEEKVVDNKTWLLEKLIQKKTI